MLEKNYHANARMATVLIAVSYWPRFSSPGSSHLDHNARDVGQLVIEDPVNRGHCQRDAVTQVQLRRAVQCT